MTTIRTIVAVLLPMLTVGSALAQQATDAIRLNQIGYYPASPKAAVFTDGSYEHFYVATPDLVDTVYAGSLGPERASPLSGETVRMADFSALRTPGTYVVAVPGLGHSHPFDIAPDINHEIAHAALKGFYYQRASTPLPAAIAGRWRRAAGHPDDNVLIHPSAATMERPAGAIISAAKGWYDAGDYNKYIVNSGITTGTLLSLYEDFPAYFDALSLGLPESGNALPDLLDEALWNIRWMQTMQDPYDGGVYHKLTTAKFAGMVAPDEANAPRFVVQKSTAATLDFAAVMAQASRIFAGFDDALPGLADSTLQGALLAWDWARQHPDVLYNQQQMNEAHDPDVVTGAYGDRNVSDEFIWAAAELYATTKADSFYTAVDLYPDDTAPLPSWSQVRTLGYYTMARLNTDLTDLARSDRVRLEQRLVAQADALIEGADESGYGSVMGSRRSDFIWGSSAVAANQGIALIQAYRLTGDRKYLDHAIGNLDYLLGRNATGYSFLTGYGEKTPMRIHHRPSEGDDLVEPVPGLLSGGPNAGQQDDCTYTSDLPALSFVDDACSYASNEIAINWNAPFAYLAGALEALQDQAGYVTAP